MRVARGCLELYPLPVIFDEVQYALDLLPYIKEKVDAYRARNGLYLLTGSQNLLLAEGGNGGGLRGRDHRKARSHRGEAVGYAAAGNGRSHLPLCREAAFVTTVFETTCCIVGGAPAGMMLGVLLSRALRAPKPMGIAGPLFMGTAIGRCDAT